MKLKRILPFARDLLQSAVDKGDIVIDATMGNGHDTLYLAQLVGEEGHVFAFDIQNEAIDSTRMQLKKSGITEGVTLIHRGHEHVKDAVPADVHGNVKGAIFNLGYLPGGDKRIVTTANTTIQAIESLLSIMSPEGVIVLVIYHGHDEGKEERDKLLTYVENLDQKMAHVLRYQFINQQNHPPFIVAIEKR
ncbi:rRNA methyltransferase [Bacillus coahuilensis m2-6]|uniref:class I SAM-dependent methyltransferase n=1 Tax=Bacillus coahuilensis TaxID=408580 RepID=UPI00018508B9|nr:class I SAM-dependent methyltransferase [Bacillus coahuilensis]KUP06331.1 rRNA methyltransferase [Bacillus coahuilensis m2-6]